MNIIEHYRNNIKESQFSSSHLSEIKEKALLSLATLETPNRKNELWKYTNLDSHLSRNFTIQEQGPSDSIAKKDEEGFHTLCFIDGVYQPGLSDDVDIKITDIRELSDKRINKFEDIFKNDFLKVTNHSNLSFGSFIEFDSNSHFEKPILFDFYYTGDNALRNTTNYVYAASNSEVNIVERVQSENANFINLSTQFYIEKNSHFHHTTLQIANNETIVGSTKESFIEADASFTSIEINLGARLSRSNIAAILKEQNATANIHGLYGLNSNQHHDTYSYTQHRCHDTFSSQLYKGILGGESRGAFTGKIRIEKDAQKVISDQLNKNLLLTPKAHANSRPQLEIYADDVKCAHGSTTGQISADELFYFESRGVTKEKAQRILAQAFAGEIVFKIKSKRIQNLISNELKKRELI